MTVPITLASGSAIRAEILRSANVPFKVARPDVDEDVIKASWNGPLSGLAQALADAKCMKIAQNTQGLVIGSDQILEFEGRGFDKPKTMSDAKDRLLFMAGKPHYLINAVTVALHGEIIWRNLDKPALYMRMFSEHEVDTYLENAGDDILSSVGAYQIEKLGARLFDRIEGDYFSVLGMSLFPLLDVLRREGGIDF